MSGGAWNYYNEMLSCDIFDVSVPKPWASHAAECRREALKKNPFGDREISELVYDVFELLVARDFLISSDICEDTYNEYANAFKDKWFKQPRGKRLERIVDEAVNGLKDELMEMIKKLD